MSVINITEGWSEVEAGGDDRVLTATRVFTVLVNTPADRGVFTWPITSGTITIPAPGTAHPDDAERLSGVPQVRKTSPAIFQVRVPYKTIDPVTGSLPTSHYLDPLSVPADVSWGGTRRQVAYDRDMDGHAVANVLGEPFDPPPQKDIYDIVLVIERNEATWSTVDQIVYIDSTNFYAALGFDAGAGRIVEIAAKAVYAATTYARVRYEIHFRVHLPPGDIIVGVPGTSVAISSAHAWYRMFLNQGVWYMEGGEMYPSPNGEIVLLAIDGIKVAPANATWLGFREYASADWAALALE